MTFGGDGEGEGRTVLAVSDGVVNGGGFEELREYRLLKDGTLKFGVAGETLRTLEDPKIELGRGDLVEGRASRALRALSMGGENACIDMRLLPVPTVRLEKVVPVAIDGSNGGRSGRTKLAFTGDVAGDEP